MLANRSESTMLALNAGIYIKYGNNNKNKSPLQASVPQRYGFVSKGL